MKSFSVFKLLWILAILFMITTAGILNNSGSAGGKTGSPGDNNITCTECHGGTASIQNGWITSNIPIQGYSPNTTYTITATGTHSGVVKFGFEATAEDSIGSKTGMFIITNSIETKLVNSNHAVTHKSTGNTPSGNSKSWSFDWTAPASIVGEITFYAAFNAANGNDSTTGDVIFKSEMTVTANTTSIEENELNQNILIYPNPALDYIAIEFKDISGISGLRLYNGIGELVMEKQISNHFEKLNVAELNDGIYYMVIDGIIHIQRINIIH
ncbi:choice-of-anchor V domain-containing protein [Bacteroidota bacterium]